VFYTDKIGQFFI